MARASDGDGGGDLYAGLGDDEVTGGDGRDFVYGDVYCCVPRSGGDDVIRTLGGDDVVDSYWGDDDVDTGAGYDRVDDNDGVDLLRAGGGNDELVLFLDAGDDVDGGAGRDDALVFTDREAGLVWDLGSGTVSAPVPATMADFEVISATEGEDVLTGTDEAERFFTFGGDDSVTARGGDDYLAGHGGDDLLDAGAGTDQASGGGGTDDCPGAERTSGCESP